MSRLPAKDRKLVERICDKQLTHLSRPKLVSVGETCRAIEEAKLRGAFLEVGCGLGGSSILIATVKYPKRPFRIYDGFETLPTPMASGTPDAHGGDRTDTEGEPQGPGEDADQSDGEGLYGVVLGNLRSFGIDPKTKSISLFKGPVQKTMKIDGLVAFAHVVGDRYDAVMTCLTRIIPKLSTGGSIILDAYDDWGGCRKAAEECMEGIATRFSFDDSAGSMKLTRLAR